MQRLWISQGLCALFCLVSTSVYAESRLCEFSKGVTVPCVVLNLGPAPEDPSGLPDLSPETIIEDSKFSIEELGEGTSTLHLHVLNDRDWATIDRQVIGSMYKQYVGMKMSDLVDYRAAQIEQALRKKYGLEGADRAAVLEAAALYYKLPLIDVPGDAGSSSPLDLSKLLGK